MKRKVQRYRGSKTHGSGSMKKRRGAGHRGGRGNAGSGKRGDAKKPSYWNKKQLKPKSKKRIGINVSSLDKNLSVWLENKIVEQKDGFYVIDLRRVGFKKLLGSGNVKNKYNIICESATEGAVEKIKAAGGDVQVQ